MKQRDRIRELLRSAHQRALRGEWEMVHQDVADALRVAESDPENQYYARLHEAAERIRPGQ